MVTVIFPIITVWLGRWISSLSAMYSVFRFGFVSVTNGFPVSILKGSIWVSSVFPAVSYE